jgi:soluble lytic murein transglycosylase-like protein
MFDPIENAMYAARFLKQLHAEHGDWSTATGAYHSRTQQHAEQYLAKVRRHLSEAGNPFSKFSQARDDARSSRVNTFPLFHSDTDTSRLGSLVPDLSGSRASIFARP